LAVRNSSKQWSNYIMKKVNILAGIIRDKKKISFGELCVAGHIAPSTLYSYKKILLAKCKDIEFDGDNFKVVGVEK